MFPLDCMARAARLLPLRNQHGWFMWKTESPLHDELAVSTRWIYCLRASCHQTWLIKRPAQSSPISTEGGHSHVTPTIFFTANRNFTTYNSCPSCLYFSHVLRTPTPWPTVHFLSPARSRWMWFAARTIANIQRSERVAKQKEKKRNTSRQSGPKKKKRTGEYDGWTPTGVYCRIMTTNSFNRDIVSAFDARRRMHVAAT